MKRARQPIKIVLPDTGPLISLALGNALDLLLLVAQDVQIVLTDVVELEATRRSEELPDARAILAPCQANAERIEIMPTTIGTMASGDLRRRAQGAGRRRVSPSLCPGIWASCPSPTS